MEGPSLFLAAELLAPFARQTIHEVSGNTKIGKERLLGKQILSIFSYGKYLFLQFDTFALRTHFLLFGTFEAVVNGVDVTGDYKRTKVPRLKLILSNGELTLFNCSIHYIEQSNAQEYCDYTIDIMSDVWDEKKVLKKLKLEPEKEIGDALLDQKIFLGVGNIIKNESLFLSQISPLQKIKEIPLKNLKQVIATTRAYVFDFYKWRKKFELKQHYQVYRQSLCKQCGSKITKKRTGIYKRFSYICPFCQIITS